jgi:sugar phosphate isomerase/epimerase
VFKNLSASAIGLRNLSLQGSLDLARQTGFAGIDFGIREVAELVDAHGIEYVRDLFRQSGVRPGNWGLPVNWRSDDEWQKDVAELPRLAALGRELGCSRTSTWIPPFSDERDMATNFAWHVERFRAIAKPLADQGVRLGLEFIGPKTLRVSHRYEFVHTMDGMLEMIQAIGTGNVGLLLDCWHLYTSHGQMSDLDRLTASDIVVVHVNDAPAGIPIDEQIDSVRTLPMETGVIDLPGFMQKLVRLGYDGPVTVEPFSKSLVDLAQRDPLAAVQRTAESLNKLWKAAGLA